MVIDTTVTRQIWTGTVIARFTLSSHEVVGTGIPMPYYLSLPRNSYLPLVQEKIKEHFNPYINQSKTDHQVWFDFDGKPLKWHYPIGVLVDVFHPNGAKNVVDITVHFEDFPDELMLQFQDINAIEASFMSMLKEADHLKHRGQVINNMNKSQHKQLWNSLRAGNYDLFWSINSKLMNGYEDTGMFKSIPLRIYENDSVQQALVSPVSDDGKTRTLSDYVTDYLRNRQLPDFCVITHGIEVPLDAPLQWLSEHMSYADNFIHLAIIEKRA